MIFTKRFLLLSAATLFPVSNALADFDVSPSVLNGKIVTNAYTDEGAAPDNDFTPFVSNVRVFDFGFDDLGPPPSTQDPGFHPRPGSGFTNTANITVGAVSGLSYWDGQGSPSFSPAASIDSFFLQYGTKSLTIDASGFSGAPLTLGSPNPADDGEFDRHLQSTLLTSDNSTPSDGLYLFELQVSDPGDTSQTLTPSDPAYILFSVNADDEVDSAKDYLRDTFAPGTNLAPVPEPASAALLGVGMIAVLRRRRRNL